MRKGKPKNIIKRKPKSFKITKECNEKMNKLQKINNFSNSLILKIGIRIVYEHKRKHNV